MSSEMKVKMVAKTPPTAVAEFGTQRIGKADAAQIRLFEKSEVERAKIFARGCDEELGVVRAFFVIGEERTFGHRLEGDELRLLVQSLDEESVIWVRSEPLVVSESTPEFGMMLE